MAKHSLSYSTATGSSQSKPQSQVKLDSMLKQKKCPEVRAKAISDRILYMICADLRPVRMVEGSDFKSLMATVEPGYTISSRKYFTNLLQTKYRISGNFCVTKTLRLKTLRNYIFASLYNRENFNTVKLKFNFNNRS